MTYRIGEVAQLADVAATTIRYYEDCGLLTRPARGANGYRTYDQRDVARVRFVSRARELQLSTDDLRDLVQAWETDDCGAVAQQMRAQVEQRRLYAQARIVELDKLVGELQRVAVRLEGSPHSGRIVQLSAAEQGCCMFFVFSLQITAQTLRLEITGPDHARQMLESAFGA